MYNKEPANRAKVAYGLSSNGKKTILTTRVPAERKGNEYILFTAIMNYPNNHEENLHKFMICYIKVRFARTDLIDHKQASGKRKQKYYHFISIVCTKH